MDHLVIAVFAVVYFFPVSIQGGRFDPSTIKPLPPPPSAFMNTSQLVGYYGYKSEVYYVQTEDGYILPLIHIVKHPGPPVLLVSGLFAGGEPWVIHGPGHDIGYILADLGYDVWIGCQRGNAETSHVELTTSHPAFWDFSHDEIGYYDLAAMVDKVLSKSSHTRLYYGAISLGSTIYMSLCSERPEYEAAFAGSFHFVPSMWMPGINDLIPEAKFFLGNLHSALEAYLDNFGQGSFLRRNLRAQHAIKNWGDDPVGSIMFRNIVDFITGFKESHMAPGWYGYTFSELGSGTSVRSVNHLLQLIKTGGGTRKYDHGLQENLKRYGTAVPPSYNLTKISSPTAIYYTKNDKLITYTSHQKTMKLLGNLIHTMECPDPTYGHLEFAFGKDLYKFLYGDVVDFLDSLSGLGNSF